VIKLQSSELNSFSESTGEPFVIRLSANIDLPAPLKLSEALVVKRADVHEKVPTGFRSYFFTHAPNQEIANRLGSDRVFVLPEDLQYLDDGDVIRLSPSGHSLRVLYRRNSNHNSLLVTERCNSYCLMCSQPPKKVDDSYLVRELLQAIPLMDRGTRELGITGGEPALLGVELVSLIRVCKNYLPKTSLHVLSNGRKFEDAAFARAVSEVGHPDLMFGIPLYSDISNQHDYVVQADGAYDETIRGILNLKACGVRVEIRVVIHQQTYKRLPQLAEFISRNLLFVDHVALMGLEMIGFTRPNLNELWVDPSDYQQELLAAVRVLSRARMNVSIYNHQLCVLHPELWPFQRKSISDWKNEFMAECEPCSRKSECGGFFSSAKYRYSSHIKPFALAQA
jgi:His-Xaa-Ser system radical SAM maturase HxsC